MNSNAKWSRAFYLIPLFLFLGFVFFFSMMTLLKESIPSYSQFKPSSKNPSTLLMETKFNQESLQNLSSSLEKSLREHFFAKFDLINVAGALARIAGLNTFNGIQKFSNGLIGGISSPKLPVPLIAQRIIALNGFLEKRNIKFLLVMPPDKYSFSYPNFAPGYVGKEERSQEELAQILTKSGVAVVDMGDVFKKESWNIRDVFFKTDHHWTPKAALEAARQTMLLLEKRDWAKYQKNLLSENQYTVKKLKKWFLGSFGRRVGIWYGGRDDIDIYYPKFQLPHEHWGQWFGTWFYRKDMLENFHIKKKDYFNIETYRVYLSSDLSLRILKNVMAINEKPVVVLGDSFHRPWLYFMSTQFREIYDLDLRYFNDSTLAQFVSQIKPSLVILLQGFGAFFSVSKMTAFGVDEFNQAIADSKDKRSAIFEDIQLESPNSAKNSFIVVNYPLKAGKSYTLTLEGTTLKGGSSHFIQMTLQDLSTNKPVQNRYFWANSTDRQKWIFSVPRGSSDSFALYLYAGTKGQTSGSSARVNEMSIYEGILET